MATIIGTSGDDFLTGTPDDDTLAGGAGNDFMDGMGGSDVYVFGRGDGQDTIMAQAWGPMGERDQLKFGSGISMADVAVRMEGADLILSLKGSSDSVRLAGYMNGPLEQRMTVLFADGAVWDAAAIDRKLNWSDDYLTLPFDQAGTLDGGLGNDMLIGSWGDDILYGGAGNDFMDGGAGSDVYVFGRGDGQDTIMVQPWGPPLMPPLGGQPYPPESVLGSQVGDHDQLRFGSGISMADVAVRAEGADLILQLKGSSDSVRLQGYRSVPPEQRPSVQFADGAVWDAMAIDRKLNWSDDYLSLPPDQPGTLDGGLGNDFLMGSMGNDILYGGAGKDFMDGMGGSDTYVFGRGDGQDTIMAQAWGQPGDRDRLKFGAGISMADVAVRTEGADIILSLKGSSDSVRLNGYMNAPLEQRLSVEFADGAVWDSAAIERKLYPSDDYLGLPFDQPGTLDGGLGNDFLMGSMGNDILYGGAGKDFMDGMGGSDTYVFGRGDGQDTIMAQAWGPMGERDRLKFGSGIGMSDVAVRMEGADLILSLKGSSDSVRLSGYMNAPIEQRLSVEFADGAVWDSATIERKLYPSDDYLGLPFDQPGTLDGGLGNDQLMGSMGNDILYGGAGKDFMDGMGGSDTYVFGRGDGQDTIMAQAWGQPGDRDRLKLGSGISMADVNVYAEGADIILSLKGGSDSVRLLGYMNAPIEQRLSVEFADGAVWDSATIDRKLYPSSDFLALPFDQAGTLDGGLGNDILYGSMGNDILYGGAGNDHMSGLGGSDTYVFGRGDGQDTIMAQAWGQPGDRDRLKLGSGISMADVNVYAEGADIILSLKGSSDSVRLLGYMNGPPEQRVSVEFADGAVWDSAAIDRKLYPSDDFLALPPDQPGALDGGLGDDFLMGSMGDDILYGGAGKDFMDGMGGSDTYVFGRGDGQDTIMAQAWGQPGDRDRLKLGSGISMADVNVYAEGADVILQLKGSSDSVRLSGYMNAPLEQRLSVEFADGAVWDSAVIDRKLYPSDDFLALPPDQPGALDGGLGDDVLIGSMGNDILYGDDGYDQLFGGDGDDQLDGGTGKDTMLGGRGNDVYVVDHIGDVVVEYADEGIDLVQSSVSYALNANVENLSLTGAAAINGTGNALNNVLTGNGANNILDGWAGADTMIGGAGDDTYIVDNIADLAVESANEGIDTVQSSLTYTLGDNVENLTLTGTVAITGTGNALNNVLTGNSAANTLVGGAGDDTLDGAYGADMMLGGIGNDTYLVDNPGDVVVEYLSQGIDTVVSKLNYTLGDNVENLTLTGTAGIGGIGNALNNVLTGNSGINTLSGGAGNDTLDGGAGNDTLIGGSGNDTYIMGRGYGADRVQESDTTAGTDVLQFLSGIATDQLWFRRVSSNLEVSIIGTSDKATVTNWYLGSTYHVEQFKTADGKTLLNSQVQNLVQAMAAFAPPPAGQTTLSPSYAAALTPVIAANWQ